MFASKDTLLTRPSGYSIARSVRLRSSASAYFNRTPASATNRKTWTWSAWVKRGTLNSGELNYLFMAGASGNETVLTFSSNDAAVGANDSLSFYSYSGGFVWQKTTAQLFRDVSAWYHIVVVLDTDNATAEDRARVYVNGTRVTSWQISTNPSSGYASSRVNDTVEHDIGKANFTNRRFDGYLTEINFIDGQALTPSSFGETDSITGVWKAKKYSGTYGTNGFYLNFSDNSSNTATTIGKDYSGNGNNWTPNNISVTSGVTYDSMTDVPTLTSATQANFAVMNPLSKNSSTSITNGNLNVSGNVIYGHAQATIFVTSGKWYFEAQLTTQQNDTAIGLGNSLSDPQNKFTGENTNSIGYLSDGRLFYNGNSIATYSSYTTTDIVACAFDCATGKIWIAKNNTWQNSGDPVAGTGAVQTVSWTDFTALARTVGSGALAFNFGQRPFAYTPPTGFVALNTYNLPESTIKNGAAYMAATVYSGNSPSSQTVSNAVNGFSFQPDLVWQKSRTQTYSNVLYDSVRGVQKRLSSNETAAESTASTAVTAFTSSGFTTGADGEMNDPTGGSNNHVAWMWKAGTTSASNTNGSITSSVSAGATQGFSVVTYTGTGANATVGHGLGVAPSMIIVKKRSGANAWFVGATPAGWNKYLLLNTTDASATDPGTVWQATAPTSSVFYLGTTGEVNANTATFVAYCFAAVAGYSAFGSYTGNGSTDGPFVYTGFRPRFVLVKTYTTTQSWQMYDSARDTYNQVTYTLFANGSNAEASNNGKFDFLSNGFKMRDGDFATNKSGESYIYMAFAENPFKNSLAR